MAENEVSHKVNAADKEKREEKETVGSADVGAPSPPPSSAKKPSGAAAATAGASGSNRKKRGGGMSAKKRYSVKRAEEKAALHFSSDDDEEHEKLSFEGNTPEVGGRAKWLERQRDREGKNKKLSQSKDGTFFSYMFLEKIFKDSRRCKLCGSSDSGKPFTDDVSSLELYLSERGICGRQRLHCSTCKEVFPVISCDTESEIPDQPEYKIDGSSVRYYCKKAMHFDILHDLMDLLHIAALDTDRARREKHYELAEFMIYNAKKVCREWCRPENSELRSKRFLRLRKETLLDHHKPVFTIDHNTEYREMYEMMEGSFRQHRDKIRLLLELLKVTLFDNPTQSAFFLWLSISMIHAECYTQFKERHNPKIYAQVDSTEYQSINERFLGLQVALGVKKIPICLMLFELPRFYHYIEFLRERVGDNRPTKFLTDDDRRTLEKFDRQGQKYLSKRRIRSGKIVSAEAYLELLTAQEMIDKENMFRGSNDKQKTKLEYMKWQKKYKKDDKQRRLVDLQEGDGKVVREISDSLDHLEQRRKVKKEDSVPFPPARQRALGPLRQRTSLEKDMVAEQTLHKPYKSRIELLMEEDDRQWGLDGNWSRKDVLLVEEDMMFERRVCIRFKHHEQSYKEGIPACMHVLSPTGRMPTQGEVIRLIDKLLTLEMDPISFDGASSDVSESQKKRWDKPSEQETDDKSKESLPKPAEEDEKEEEKKLNEEKKVDGEGGEEEVIGGGILEQSKSGLDGSEVPDDSSIREDVETSATEVQGDSNKSPPPSSNPQEEKVTAVKTETKILSDNNPSVEETVKVSSTIDPEKKGGKGEVSNQPEETATENQLEAKQEKEPDTELVKDGEEKEEDNDGPADNGTKDERKMSENQNATTNETNKRLNPEKTGTPKDEEETAISEKPKDAYSKIMEMKYGRRSRRVPVKPIATIDRPNPTTCDTQKSDPEDLGPACSPPPPVAPACSPLPPVAPVCSQHPPIASVSSPPPPIAPAVSPPPPIASSPTTTQEPPGSEQQQADDDTPSNPTEEKETKEEDQDIIAKSSDALDRVSGSPSNHAQTEEEPKDENVKEKEEQEEEKVKKEAEERAAKQEEEEEERVAKEKEEEEERVAKEKEEEEERAAKEKEEEEERAAKEKEEEEERAAREKEEEEERKPPPPPKKEKKLSKRKEKKMEKKAKQLIEAVQRRKVIEDKYFQERVLRRTPSEEAFERLKREKKDCTLAELTPEENQILMNHVRKQKRRDRLEMEEEWDRAMMSRRKGKSPAVMRSRLRHKLQERRKEDDEFYSKLRKRRREREREKAREKSPPSLSSDSSSDDFLYPPLSRLEKTTSKPEKMAAEVKEKLDKKGHSADMPKTEPMKPKSSEPATKSESDETTTKSKPAEPSKPMTPTTKEPSKPTTKEPSKPTTKESLKPTTKEPSKPTTKEPSKPTTKEPSKPKNKDPAKPKTLDLKKSKPPPESSKTKTEAEKYKVTEVMEKEVVLGDGSASPPLGRYLAVTIKGTAPDSRLLTPVDFRNMLVDHLRANDEAEEREKEVEKMFREEELVPEAKLKSAPEAIQVKDIPADVPAEPEAWKEKEEEEEEAVEGGGGGDKTTPPEEDEKEAEKKDKKRRRRNEKKKANKQKKEERQAVIAEQEKAKTEQDKAKMELEKAKAELERVKAEQNAESTTPLPKLKDEIITLERKKPENPEFNIDDYLDHPDMLGTIPLMLTMVPCYITLDDMSDVENKRENKSVSAFIYKVSLENGGKDHPFHDIFRFAQLRQTDLDIIIEVSPIQASRNHEDVLRLAGRPGRLSYSCKLEVSELCIPVGKKPMSATLPIRPGYPNLAALEATFNEGMYSFAKLTAAASNQITEKKPHTFDFGVKMDESKLIHTQLSRKKLSKFMDADPDTVQMVMEKELAKQKERENRKERRKKVPKVKEKIAELKTTSSKTPVEKQKEVKVEADDAVVDGSAKGKESRSKSTLLNGSVELEQPTSGKGGRKEGEGGGEEEGGGGGGGKGDGGGKEDQTRSSSSSIITETRPRLRKTARDKFQHCDNCGEEIADRIQLCSGCKKVAYCNNHCQKAHWKHHKKTCAYHVQKPADQQRERAKTCGSCGKELNDRILMCSGCKKIAYCDSLCQKTHWKLHKKTCSYSNKQDAEI